MTSADPDAVKVLARVLHGVYCLPGANPYHRYSPAHRAQDERRAVSVLAGLAEASRTVSPAT